MVKIIFFVVCLISAFGGSSTSSNIECSYGDNNYFVLGNIYLCVVANDPNIKTEESAQISGINGSHSILRNDDDVVGFFAYIKTIQVFPKGLGNFFKNLKVIFIYDCQLKEIHQSNLKVFPNLVYLYLYRNGIEVIEEGLFDFNPNLQVVGFWEPKIVHIDPNVFDHLHDLKYFYFSGVSCVYEDIDNSERKVQEILKVVKSKCSNSQFLSLENQIEILEIESKTLSSSEFIIKLKNLEDILRYSKFSKFRPLSTKFQNLKLKSVNNVLDEKTVPLATNDTKLIEGPNNVTDKFECVNLSQSDLKLSIDELKSAQNVLTVAIEDLKLSQSQFMDFKVQINKKLDQNEKELTNKLRKMSTYFDEKIEGIEKRLMRMLEEILEEKLGNLIYVQV